MIINDLTRLFGYAQLAEVLETTPGALHTAKSRGRLSLQPIGYLGRMPVFDRQQALEYKGLKNSVQVSARS